jgi:hypothetical protein
MKVNYRILYLQDYSTILSSQNSSREVLHECKKKVHYPQIQTLDRQTTPDYIYIERIHVNGDLIEYSLMQTSHAKDHLNNTVREQSSIVEDATSPNTSTRTSISHEELRNQVPGLSPLGPEHSDPYQSTDPVTSHLEIFISICRGSHNPFYVRMFSILFQDRIPKKINPLENPTREFEACRFVPQRTDSFGCVDINRSSLPLARKWPD